METEFKNVFSVTKNGKTYSFHVPDKAPFGEALDSLFEIITSLADMQKAAIEAFKPSAQDTVVTAQVTPDNQPTTAN